MKPMTDERWARHANPWSVWTRFAAIPAFMLAVWSRVWIGSWSLVPVGIVMIWLVLNVLVFPPVREPRSWVSKGIYGEQLWLQNRDAVPPIYAIIQRWLIALGFIGMVLLGVGLHQLELWMSLCGMAILILAQLWRIDRFSMLYELHQQKLD
mgnify:CR=1 FL=1